MNIEKNVDAVARYFNCKTMLNASEHCSSPTEFFTYFSSSKCVRIGIIRGTLIENYYYLLILYFIIHTNIGWVCQSHGSSHVTCKLKTFIIWFVRDV